MMSDHTTNRLLSLPAMARELRVTQRWLKAEVRDGRLPAIDADGRLLFNRAAVERALLDRAEKGGSDATPS